MHVDIPINGAADIITLLILAVILAFGVRVVVGFFRKPKRKSTSVDFEAEPEKAEASRTKDGTE